MKNSTTTQTLEQKIEQLDAAGFNIARFKKMWEDTIPYYIHPLKKMQLLDAVDKGRLWEAVNVQMPIYQLTPDTNYVSKTKMGLLGSIYSVTKSADVIPSSDTDKDLIKNLNTFLALQWQRNKIGFYQFQAGERSALMNIGITQVGWQHSILGGSGDQPFTEDISLKNINPMKFRRDPFATNLDTSSFCLVYDIFHESIFESSDLYKDEYTKYKNSGNMLNNIAVDLGLQQIGQASYTNADKYHVLFTFWIRDRGKIHEVHIIDLQKIVVVKTEIEPNMYPFAICYCNPPAEDLVGTSECSKIFANNLVYNLMDSIVYTAEYKNQRPPRFVSAQSNINLPTFIKHGAEADRVFVVNGDASKAVHYHEFPTPSAQIPALQKIMAQNIGTTTGIDDRYMGRDTGSVITTGGMEDMLSRVTLVDSPKIILYEDYVKQLTKLVLYNYLTHPIDRSMYYQDLRTKQWKTVNVQLTKIDPTAIFDYEIDISNDLPRNKQRMEATALQLMEKQLQYEQAGKKVQWITPEELLMFMDLGPMTEYMLERMAVQRMQNSLETVSETIATYGGLIAAGMKHDDALYQTASAMDQRSRGISPQDLELAENYVPESEGIGRAPSL